MKTNFNDCLELITDPDIKKFTKKALKRANKGFWTSACSSTGKFHPPENQLKGGIVIHSRKMVQIAVSLFRFFKIEDPTTQSQIISAVILHDICKRGKKWEVGFARDHGPLASEWLYKLCSKDEKSNKNILFILALVRNHMAVWNFPSSTPALKKDKVLKNTDIAHLVVQLADYWSSRKWCPFYIDEIVQA